MPYHVLSLSLVTMTCAFAAAASPDGPERRLGPLGPRVQEVLERVSPSIVYLRSSGAKGSLVTGTIITSDGLIATCAHMPAKVGDPVDVHLGNNRKAQGKVLTKLAPEGKEIGGRDIALVQLAGKGPWPAVEIGTATGIADDDSLLAVGFGATGLYGGQGDEPPRCVRLGRRLGTLPAPGKVLTTTIIGTGGDSGGPLFDLGGRLVGLLSFCEADGRKCRYATSDTLRAAWKVLALESPALPPLAAGRPATVSLAEEMAVAVRAIRPAVVEVLSDDRWVAVGIVVGDGFILTKASELGPKISIVLGGDTPARARVVATDPARDLAIVEIQAKDLAGGIVPVQWLDLGSLPVGTVVAAGMPPDFTSPAGVVSIPARTIPPISGIFPVMVKDAQGGVEVTKILEDTLSLWMRPTLFPLRVGDVVTQIAGVPTVNREAFLAMSFDGTSLGHHPRIAGERVAATYRRDDATAEVAVQLGYQASAPVQGVHPSSYRYSGFPSAFATDLAARPEHCGAPVVDARGRIVGLLIARAPFVESLVLPASEVAASLELMRGQMKTTK